MGREKGKEEKGGWEGGGEVRKDGEDLCCWWKRSQITAETVN